MIPKTLRTVLFAVGTLLTAAVLTSDLLLEPAHRFLAATARSAAGHLAAVTAARLAAVSLLEGVGEILDRVLNLLLLSNLLLILQLALLEIGRSWAFKLLLLAASGLCFALPTIRRLILPLAIGLALVNPGLPLYTLGVQAFAQHAVTGLSDRLATELVSPPRHQADMDEISDRSGRRKPFLTPAGIERLLAASLRYFISTLLLFLVLPFAYLAFLTSLLRRLLKV